MHTTTYATLVTSRIGDPVRVVVDRDLSGTRTVVEGELSLIPVDWRTDDAGCLGIRDADDRLQLVALWETVVLTGESAIATCQRPICL